MRGSRVLQRFIFLLSLTGPTFSLLLSSLG